MKIFVFGSNLAGRHGKGAALYARQYYGAKYGQGKGLQGSSYAIPTKDQRLRSLSLNQIALYVKEFVKFAAIHPEMNFEVTRIGCGLAGFTASEIAPLFQGTSKNCIFAEDFQEYL